MLSLRTRFLALAAVAPVVFAGTAPPGADTAELARQVRDAERGFAKTMADRDHAAFATFLAQEAVFFGQTSVHRGKQEVAEAWKDLYQAPEAPFSWEPEQVEVLHSGTLAHSSGPVRDRTGKRVGTFNSVWRREADGRWRVVFDKGCPWCDCK